MGGADCAIALVSAEGEMGFGESELTREVEGG